MCALVAANSRSGVRSKGDDFVWLWGEAKQLVDILDQSRKDDDGENDNNSMLTGVLGFSIFTV